LLPQYLPSKPPRLTPNPLQEAWHIDDGLARLLMRQERRERDAINDAVLTYRKLGECP
jgi:hypothetical protein